jgi:hypothetical protein
MKRERDFKLTPTPNDGIPAVSVLPINEEEDFKVKTVKNQKFINFNNLPIDLDALTKIFNSYATKKTIATGFFNLALVATNFAQMKQVITVSARAAYWTPLSIVLLCFIAISLALQFFVAVALIFMAKSGEFIDETKRNQLIRSNNGVTLMVLAISIINIFINIFISI